MKKYIFIVSLLSLLGCYKTVNLDIDQGFKQVVVEGMIVVDQDNPLKVGGDIIKLSYSMKYNSSTDTLEYIKNATLVLRNLTNGTSENLQNLNNGKYKTVTTVPLIGNEYELSISIPSGETTDEYTAKTRIPFRNADYRGLPQKDTCRQAGTPIGPIPYGVFVDLDLYDLPGKVPDAYVIRSFVKRKDFILKRKEGSDKDDTIKSPYFNKAFSGWNTFRSPNKLITALDFTNGGQNSEPFEGQDAPTKLILPIRLNATMSNDTVGGKQPVYFPKDSLRVECMAVTVDNLQFLAGVDRELNNGAGGGLSGLFARPPANVTTNIINTKKDGKKGLGWFGGGLAKSYSIEIKDFEFIKDQDKPNVIPENKRCP